MATSKMDSIVTIVGPNGVALLCDDPTSIKQPLLGQRASGSITSEAKINNPDSGVPGQKSSANGRGCSRCFQTVYRALSNSDRADPEIYKNDESRTKRENAALCVRQGEDYDKFFPIPTGKWSKRAYNILHHPVFYVIDLIFCVLLMLLILIEKPETCVFTVQDEKVLVIVHAALELLCLSILLFDIILRLIWLQLYHFIRHRSMLVMVILIVMCLEALVVLVRVQNHIRITRALRPLFFIDTHLMSGLRRVLRQIFQSIKPILDVLLLLLFVIAIFSVIGYLLFATVDPTYFLTFERSCVSLFIAMTTANNPNVMMEAYRINRASALFFILYLIITLYFISNVLVAIVYSSFSEEGKKKFRKHYLHRREALYHAYHILASNDGISFHDFLLFMQEYRPQMPEWQVMCIFKVLHRKPNENPNSHPSEIPNENLSEDEFYDFYRVKDHKWKEVSSEENQVWYKNFHNSLKPFFEGMYKLVTWKWFNTIGYVVVLSNALFLIIYSIKIPASWRYEKMNEVLPVSFAFISIYWLEIIIKIIGLGPLDYFKKFWNLFDFVVILGSFIALLLELDPRYYFLAAIRPIKLIRLLRLKRRYRDIMNTLLVITPRLISVGLLLVIIYYFFAVIGLELFQGAVEHMCCADAWYGVGTFYQDLVNETTINAYYLNSFDNAINSYVTLFILMVVNNWYIIMEGFASEVESEWIARIYFMIFYIITLVVLNVIIAFIVEAFVSKISAVDRQRKCQRHNDRWNCDCIEDEQHKKEKEIQLVRDDIDKLKSEVDNRNEEERGKDFNFNRYWRNSKRIKVTDTTTFIGWHLRSRDDIYLLLYKDQLSKWNEELKQQQLRQKDTEKPQPESVTKPIWNCVKKVLEFILE